MTTHSHKVNYRGVDVDTELAPLIRHMPAVDATRETLLSLQGVWDSLAMLGELSGTGVEISGVRAAFSTLTSTLVNELGGQACRKAAQERLVKAQVTVDILVRNLFERTADIGFLATDEDIRQFAACESDERNALLPALRQRLLEYQRKYSVYEDIILLSPEGEVLARLDDSVDVPRTRDRALLEEAARTQQAYVEIYRPFDLRPTNERSLIYASRVTDASGQRVLGVLCLSFRFEDECQRIFRKFVDVNDWSVVALLDAEGAVIASSDPFQVPVGAHVAAPGDGQANTVRFAGRHWLAVTCEAHPFQGYAGPGWRGHAMTPIEHAFAQDDDQDTTSRIDPATAQRLRNSRVLFPDAMRDIAHAAARIEADLARALWNGNVALTGTGGLGNDVNAHNVGFSRTLLREIGRTGARTRQGFTSALDAMSGTASAATLAGVRSRAALTIDIMDRSLYERANDCRWWALTSAFRAALEGSDAPDAEALGDILRTIHSLYTVYANLVLFDRQGRVVAVSRADDAALPGQQLDAEWVARTLALGNTQAYCVSPFEPSPLYGGRSTYVYAAAVRGLANPSRVVGGVAIVFDSEPQFRSMLQDTLPRDAKGEPVEGAFGVLVGHDGKVLASSDDTHAVGSTMDLAAAFQSGTVNEAKAAPWHGRWYAVGAGCSTGYREFKGRDDPYQERITALAFEALTEVGEAEASEALVVATAPPQRSRVARNGAPGHEPVDLATLRIGDQWHALQGRDLVEAMRADGMLPLPGRPAHVRGSVMFHNKPIAVLDANALLGLGQAPAAAKDRQIVVLRPQGQTRTFGLLVDALGDNPQVAANQLVRLAEGAWQRSPAGMPLIDTVVAAAPGSSEREMLTLLSAEALATLV